MQVYVANTYRRHVVFSLALLAFSFSLIFFLPSFHSTVSFFIPSTPYFFLAFLFSLFFSFRIFLTFLLFKRAENFFATSGYPSTGPPSLPLLFPFFFPLLATFNYTTATIFTPLVHHAACFRERNIFAVPRRQKPCVVENSATASAAVAAAATTANAIAAATVAVAAKVRVIPNRAA